MTTASADGRLNFGALVPLESKPAGCFDASVAGATIGPFPTATVFMARARVEAHPEIARHLAVAFVRALDYIHAHTAEEIAAIVPKEVRGKDEAAYLAALRESLPMFAGDGRRLALRTHVE